MSASRARNRTPKNIHCKPHAAGGAAIVGAIADRIDREACSLPEAFGGLLAEKPKVKYANLKALRVISDKNPARLYPEFDQFVGLLGSENNILKWGAISIIGNLAAVDSDGKIDGILDRYLRPISGPVMITAGNTIAGAGKIALAKPHLAEKIARALRRVEKANYQTPECRNVAIGHSVKALDVFFENIRNQRPVLAFVERQLLNGRNAVRQKAAAFLKKHGRNNPVESQQIEPFTVSSTR